MRKKTKAQVKREKEAKRLLEKVIIIPGPLQVLKKGYMELPLSERKKDKNGIRYMKIGGKFEEVRVY